MSEYKECIWCGDNYRSGRTYFHKKGFCNEDCYEAYIYTLQNTLGTSNIKPVEKNGQSKICVICGSMYIGENEYCSAECSIPYCEEHGIWYQRVKLKLPPRYCKKFNDDLKERVRTYFDKKCVLCGKTEYDNGQALSVHYVNYDKKAGCNGNKILLVPLCRYCHRKVHGNKKYWQDYFEGILRDKYNYKCYYTKEEYNLLRF